MPLLCRIKFLFGGVVRTISILAGGDFAVNKSSNICKDFQKTSIGSTKNRTADIVIIRYYLHITLIYKAVRRSCKPDNQQPACPEFRMPTSNADGIPWHCQHYAY